MGNSTHAIGLDREFQYIYYIREGFVPPRPIEAIAKKPPYF